MQAPLLTYKPNEYIARNNANWLIIPGSVTTFIVILLLYDYIIIQNKSEGNSIGSIFSILIPLLLSIFFWYQVFDKGVKLVINEHGLWSKKYRLIPWSNIDAFYFEKVNAKVISYKLWIDTANIGESISIDLTLIEENCSIIAKAIQENSKSCSIRYSGIHEYKS